MHHHFQTRLGAALFGFGVALSACAAGHVAPKVAGAFVDAPVKVNGAAVSVRYRVSPESALGESVPVEFTFDKAREGARVEFAAGAGLALDSAARVDLPAGSSSATVIVRPTAPGRLYLNVFVSQDGRRSAISVPVQVGQKAAAQKATPAANDDDDVILLPVD